MGHIDPNAKNDPGPGHLQQHSSHLTPRHQQIIRPFTLEWSAGKKLCQGVPKGNGRDKGQLRRMSQGWAWMQDN